MKNLIQQFVGDERGTASLEFVLVFPVFFTFVLMTYESGILSARHVMLEHGVDRTVRAVRTGNILVPQPPGAPLSDRDLLRQEICDTSRILPDCMNQLEIELLWRDPLNWVAVPDDFRCIDRGEVVQDAVEVGGTANNRLMFLRACIRINPFLPTSGLGKAIVDKNSSDAAGGSYALTAVGAFVVEPFRAVSEDD